MSGLQHWLGSRLRDAADSPEVNVVGFASVLNFAWEILQAPLFAGMASAPHALAIKGCAQATLGDMVIMLFAHSTVAFVAQNRRWLLAPSGRQIVGFIGIGLTVTTVIEWLATSGHWVQRWTYAPAMPVLPIVGIGVAPLLQWLLVPLLVLWLVRRQLAGPAGGS